jgi:hypothetical protein
MKRQRTDRTPSLLLTERPLIGFVVERAARVSGRESS